MKLLLDTHLLLWAAADEHLSERAVELIEGAEALIFSAASIWEIAIKAALRRADFDVDAGVLRRELLDSGYEELAVTGAHAAAVSTLPDLHKDPFGRILVAQASVEGILLATADPIVLRYPGPIISAA